MSSGAGTLAHDCSGALNPATANKIKELNGRQGSLNSYLDYLNWFIRDICKIHEFCIGGVKQRERCEIAPSAIVNVELQAGDSRVLKVTGSFADLPRQLLYATK